MPEDRHAAPTPIMLAIASTSDQGGTLARAQPRLQLAQELVDATGQPNELLIVAAAIRRLHSLPNYTPALSMDVSNCHAEQAGTCSFGLVKPKRQAIAVHRC
jgi:hypothetical protein